ncbi:hypothetical protein CYMTET_35456, partial [Cymbomonas tetramitiformis]
RFTFVVQEDGDISKLSFNLCTDELYPLCWWTENQQFDTGTNYSTVLDLPDANWVLQVYGVSSENGGVIGGLSLWTLVESYNPPPPPLVYATPSVVTDSPISEVGKPGMGALRTRGGANPELVMLVTRGLANPELGGGCCGPGGRGGAANLSKGMLRTSGRGRSKPGEGRGQPTPGGGCC